MTSSAAVGALGPSLAVAAVARRLGVAPATLRTWDRRYGLTPSERTAGSHRRYTPEDVARLMVMRRLTLEGVAPADAARSALAADADELAATPTAVITPSDGGRPTLRAIEGGRSEFEVDRPAMPGAAIPASISARMVAVVDAALSYDQHTCRQLLALPVDGSPADWWTQIVEPAWARLEERTVLVTPGQEPTLVLADAALGALRDFSAAFEQHLVDSGLPSANHPSRLRNLALIFAAPDEMIPLSAHALGAALVAAGASARIVSGPESVRRAVELVTMVRPAAVVLAADLSRPDLESLHRFCGSFPDLPIFVGLKAESQVSSVPLAPNVHRTRSFTGLLHEVFAVVA
ncbi:MAG: MerR family transcriptional regulator [Promicromonosporaceae bacterium]|nr:MerR family transcriptional regulator [Promicromonosporaceae bacterium]